MDKDTKFLSKEEALKQKEWVLIDAKGQILGRVATTIAKILMGKHKPTYTPNQDCGDNVIVINAEKVKVTGKKADNKTYYHHTGYIGGIKNISFRELLETKPELIIEKAVKRMLPKNTLRHKIIKHLKVYKTEEHPHYAQKPKTINLT